MSGYDDRDSGSDDEPFNPQAEIDEDDVPATSAPVRRPAVADEDDEDEAPQRGNNDDDDEEEEGVEENDDDDEEDDEDEDEDEDDVVVCGTGLELSKGAY